MKAKSLVLLLLAIATLAAADVVQVEGYGLTISQAEDDARRRALEIVEGSYIKAVTKVEDMQTVIDLVISRVSGFVRIKEILEKGCEGEGQARTCRVLAKIEVLRKDIEEHLKDLMIEIGEPSVGLLITESYRSAYGSCSYPGKLHFFTASLKELLVDEGLKVPQTEALASYNEKLKSEGASRKDLIDVSLALADIVSYVFAVKVQYTGRYVPDYDVCSVRMVVEANLVRADTGDIVKSYSMNEVAAGATPEAAIKKILLKSMKPFAQDLAEQIYIDRAIRALSDRSLRVRLNLKDPEMVSGVIETLQERLVNAKAISVLNRLGDVVILSVITRDSPDDLWKEIKDACSDRYEIELGRISGKMVEVNVLSQIAQSIKETYLKFKLAKFTLSKKVKECLKSINGVEILGRTSLKPYTIKVKLSIDVEDLIGALEECKAASIELLDMAEDGSWFLFQVK